MAVESINGNIGDIKSEIGGIKSEIGGINRRLARLEDSSGNITEKLLRLEISKLFGENFSKQYTVNSLQGLIQLLSEANGLDMDREPSGIYFAARKVARKLVHDGVAKQLLSDFYEVISSTFSDKFESPCSQTQSSETDKRDQIPVINEDDPLHIQELIIVKSFCTAVVSNFRTPFAPIQNRDQRILDAFKNSLALLQLPTKKGQRQKNRIDPLKKKLEQLCKLLTLRKIDDQVNFLVQRDGPGMMIAQYIASKERHHLRDQENVDQLGVTETKLGPISRFLLSFKLVNGPLKKRLEQLYRFFTLPKRASHGIAQTIVSKDIHHHREQENVDKKDEIEIMLGSIWRFLPSFELELDLKGSVAVVGDVALIKVAEIKSSYASSRKGKNQIKSRALVLRWALQELCPHISGVTLAGHIFVNNSDGSVEEMNYLDSSGMSIFVHPM